MTAFSPGTGQRLALLDLTLCYPAGTTVWHNWSAHYSANWPGHFKLFDFYLIVGASLEELAANEATIDAGGPAYTDANVIYYTTYAGFTDDTLGNFAISPGANVSAQYTFPDTNRYVSLFVRPQFNSVPWYTDDASTIALGSTGLAGASSVACPVFIPVADFSGEPTSIVAGASVVFTDLSTNTPTSWAWDFGDGGTSTSQNPTHTYSTPGTYAVTLTATNAGGSDSETKTSYVLVFSDALPDPPGPAGVLLEIYASSPGAAKWDVAKWDEAVWSEAGWQDVTPYGMTVDITWGSNRPELGILSSPSAASWAVDYYDPDRILDPANENGPYFGDLVPYLPIRVSHRGTIVRVGYVSGISHNYHYPTAGTGYMRGADNISILANAKVPTDSTLSDTLYARAVDAIAAAGLTVSVAAAIGTDPPVSPWLTGTRDWSVWEWITDAAQEVLQIPIVDRLGVLTFRPWASPLTRGRALASPQLIDLAVVTDYSGLYSVVQARQDDTTVVERALTPPPRYGARTFTRDEITIDPGAWADTVLADRGLNTFLWKPGDLYPLTALAVEDLATIEAVELVSVSLPEQDPPVIASGIIVGGSIFVVGKANDEAVWRFNYELAQTATEPLIETGGDPTDYLLRTGGGEYLYPTGSA